jgi:wobble nucleotide-excising tRNase
MMVEQFSSLRNIGQFDSVNAGTRIQLTKLSLIYGENGRGKTTLSAILRSLSANDQELITERKRLGAQHPPHIVLNVGGATVLFENGSAEAKPA